MKNSAGKYCISATYEHLAQKHEDLCDTSRKLVFVKIELKRSPCLIHKFQHFNGLIILDGSCPGRVKGELEGSPKAEELGRWVR